MKSPEAIASELVQKHVQWEEDAECYPQWHVDRSALLISIATALREAETRGLSNGKLCTVPAASLPVRAPVEVSEEEVKAFSRQAYVAWNGLWDAGVMDDGNVVRSCDMAMGMRHCYLVGYEQAFREAMRQNAVARLDWPSEKEIAQAYDAKRAAVGGRGNTIHMMTGWLEACNWLRKRLMGEGG